MKKKTIILMAVVILLLVSTSIVFAGGIKNTVYVKFGDLDTYWKTTSSGLVHEWRTTDNRHFVFKPVGKFKAPDCDDDAINAFKWTSHTYPHDMTVSEATINDFLPYGNQFYVCMYKWQ